MKKILLLLLLFISFGLIACQSFKDSPLVNTRVILSFNQKFSDQEIDKIFHKLSEEIKIDSIELIRKNSDMVFIVKVRSSKSQNYWLATLNDSKLIRYAEIDSKKQAK